MKKWISALVIFCFSASTTFASSGVHGNTADYVVVGVGSAGGLMVKRLTDDKNTSVIALHQGKNFTESFIVKYSKNVPITVFAGAFASGIPDISSLDLPPDLAQQLTLLLTEANAFAQKLYLGGNSIPQPNADDRTPFWVEPLPLAGGTSINAGAWCRGTNQVYSQWEAIAGPLWSVDRILGIYKGLEKYNGNTPNPEFRGYKGPLNVLQDQPISKLAKVFTAAMIAASGTPFVEDYNDPLTPIGVSPQLQLTHSGRDGFYRVSSATAFLDDIMDAQGKGVNNRKLQVNFNSKALKIIWNGNTAIGVEYQENGVTKSVYANKGVIICAGLQSSSFLLNSGVGPGALLGGLNIPVIYDNPNVGQNLADQPHVVTIFTSNPLDSVAGGNRIFSQISWLPAPAGDPTSRQLRFATVDLIPGVTLGLLDLCQPLSRGSVSINSTDPTALPVIDLGLLTNSSDLDLFISGFQTYIKNMNAELASIDPLYRMIFPPPEILNDTAALTAFIQEEIGSNMHFQSHCRMAPLNEGGVVDSYGRVYGVNNVYVADNSIVPQCMDGSPMATAYLIAENIAALIIGK